MASESGGHAGVLLCGFGPGGRSLARLVAAKRPLVERANGLGLEPVGVGALSGSVLRPAGLPLAETCLAGAEILAGEGTLNGTSNFVLTRMRAGTTYADALAEAHLKDILNIYRGQP